MKNDLLIRLCAVLNKNMILYLYYNKYRSISNIINKLKNTIIKVLII